MSTEPASGAASPVALALRVVAVVGFVAAAVTARVVWSGEWEIAASNDALRAGDAHEAAAHARRAAGWYAPGAPHVRVGYDRLKAIATTAEGLGDRDVALFAWRGVRSAALETRWFETPHEGDLARANSEIARLEAGSPRPAGTRTRPPGEVEREALAALTRDEAPRAPWIVALLAGAVAFAAGLAWSVRRGLLASGKLSIARATPALVVTGAGAAVWLFALWRA